MTAPLLPALPPVAREALGDRARAQLELTNALGDADPAATRALHGWFAPRQLAAMAGLTPTLEGLDPPVLFAAPRGFLTDEERARLHGVERAFEHVLARLHLVAHAIEPLIRHETPFVLHALAEGPETGAFETNPGIIRTKVSSWIAKQRYVHPEPALLRPAIDALTTTLAERSGDTPAPVLGAWAAFVWMSLHPWVDGNGRTARLLWLLTTGAEDPTGPDLFAVEQWAALRRGYTEALQAGQHPAGSWDPEAMLPCPFVDFALATSAAGMRRQALRIAHLNEASARCTHLIGTLHDDLRALVLRTWLDRVLVPRDLAERLVEEGSLTRHEPTEHLETLVAGGVLQRIPLPPGRRTPGRVGAGYVLTQPVADALGHPLQLS